MRKAIPALRSMQRYRKKGHAARVELIGYKKSGLWYVVRIGPFQSRMAAKRYQARFEREEKKSAQIFPKRDR